MAEEIKRTNKRLKPNIKEPEWPLLLDLPLAALPMFGARGVIAKIPTAAQQQGPCNRAEDQAHELQSSRRRLGAPQSGGEEKVEQMVCKPRGEEKRSESRGPKDKGSPGLEGDGAKAGGEKREGAKKKIQEPKQTKIKRSPKQADSTSALAAQAVSSSSEANTKAEEKASGSRPDPSKDCIQGLDTEIEGTEKKENCISQPASVTKFFDHNEQFQFAAAVEKEERTGKRKKEEASPKSQAKEAASH